MSIVKCFVGKSLSVITVGVLATCCVTIAVAATRNDNGTAVGGVLLGPCGFPGAEGPTGVNDDFTNRSIDASVVNVPPPGVTTSANTIVFRNTVQNIGTGDDAYVISAPSAPPGFKVEISIDDGLNYGTIEPWNTSMTLAVAYRAAATFFVRITAPARLPLLSSFDTVVRATSMTTPSKFNETIDRVYTGFVRVEKSMIINKGTGAGGPTDAVPGAEMEFLITYANVSSPDGVGCGLLTARNVVINEDGRTAPNNWAQTTDHIIGATDSRDGIITGDHAGSTSLSDMIGVLEPGQSGVFKFRRRIK
jgi:hypothetical protein